MGFDKLAADLGGRPVLRRSFDALQACAGIEGIVVDVKIFSRKGVEKDERARQIEDAELFMMEKNLKDEIRILQDERDKRIEDLLVDFRTRRVHMAIAVDEYGGTSGLITIEDLIEEIIDLLKKLSRERDVTIISATHDFKMLNVSDQVVWIRDGTVDKIEDREELSISIGKIDTRE